MEELPRANALKTPIDRTIIGPPQTISIEKEPWGFLIRTSHIYFTLVGAVIATVFCLLLLSTPAGLTECASDKVKITEFSGINTQFTCVPVDIFYRKQTELTKKIKSKKSKPKKIKPRINKRLNRGLLPSKP